MTILGVDWGSVGKGALGGIHLAGKLVLNAFGLGAAAQALEKLEAPNLPDWAKSGGILDGGKSKAPLSVVSRPEHVVLVRKGADKPELVNATEVVLQGGKRFEGTGYKPGEGIGARKFSFGYDDPQAVEVLVGEKKSTFTDVKQILFLGGTEGATRVAGQGAHMDILGDLIMGDLDLCGMTGHTYVATEPVIAEVEDSTYIYGTTVLGAALAPVNRRLGFVFQKAPKTGRVAITLKLGKIKRGDHRSSIANARAAGNRAMSGGRRLKALLSRASVLGVAAPTSKRKGKTTFRASAQLARLADQLIKAGQASIKAADAHEGKIVAREKKMRSPAMRAQVAAVKKLNLRSAVIGEDDFELLGASSYNEEIVGALTDPDPLNPGFLIDGSPDPAYGYADPYADQASTGTITDYPGPPDWGIGPAPTLEQVQEEIKLVTARDPGPERDTRVYSSGGEPAWREFLGSAPVPEGAVYYQGERGFLGGSFASWRIAYAPDKTGRTRVSGVIGDQAGVKKAALTPIGFEWDGIGWGTWVYDGKKFVRSGGTSARSTDTRQVAMFSIRNGAGPLVGGRDKLDANRPQPPEWAQGLRYDVGKDAWFWYRDRAPAWATANEDMTLLNQALVDYKAAIAAEAARIGALVAADKLAADEAAAYERQSALDAARIANEQQVQEAAIAARQVEQEQQQSEFEQQWGQQQAAMEQQMMQQQMQAAPNYYDEYPPEEFYPAEEETGYPEEFAEEGVDWGEERGREEVPNGYYEPTSEDIEQDLA